MDQAIHPSLGNFSKLPPEIREFIWKELAPRRCDKSPQAPKADLSILRASRYLHDEITEAFHRLGPCLEFTISSHFRLENIFSTVTTTRRNLPVSQHGDNPKESDDAQPSVIWTLTGLKQAKAQGWHNLPFHKFDEVIVKLLAPNPNNSRRLLETRYGAGNLAEYFKAASSKIKHLTIRLEKHEGHDWARDYRPSDCELATRSFRDLPNVERMDVKIYTDVLAIVKNFGHGFAYDFTLEVGPELWPGLSSKLIHWDEVFKSVEKDGRPACNLRYCVL